ncbi:MAG: chromosomal replication initiator protein DnaA, partial [Chloroflexota bacterium]
MGVRSAPEIWEAALGELQLQVSKSNYRTWLGKTVGLTYQDNQFIVGVPNTFVAEYLDKNQRSLIEKTLIGLTRGDTRVTFQVNGWHHEPESYTGRDDAASAIPASVPRFNPRYTFNSFVVGSSNRMAYAAAQGVAESPGHSYNPLFIYGGPGLGKTHLLQAAGQAAVTGHTQVLCVSAEQFTNEFINAIQHRKTEEFRNKYRSVGMLLIDDIHFISGKEQTQESFFHTFNDLHNANRQIVITSDRPPQAMPLLSERLRSRFEWGLVTDIQPPDFETRLAILRTRAEQDGLAIAPQVLEFIAQQAHQNVRELEGCLNRVTAYSRLVRAEPTLELAAEALQDIAAKHPQKTPLTADLVIDAVAIDFKITLEDIKSRKRDKETALARQVAMYLLRAETDCSLAQIGKEFGRDHSTVMHACE